MRITKAYLTAQLEAARAEINALKAEWRGLRVQLAAKEADAVELQEQAHVSRARDIVKNRAELLARCRELSERGVPVFAQGDFIKHRVSKAVLVQVRQ